MEFCFNVCLLFGVTSTKKSKQRKYPALSAIFVPGVCALDWVWTGRFVMKREVCYEKKGKNFEMLLEARSLYDGGGRVGYADGVHGDPFCHVSFILPL